MITYFRSSTDRLTSDDKAICNCDLVEELGAYAFQSQLILSLIRELSENLPLKLPEPYETVY